jgi:hypothetical protein
VTTSLAWPPGQAVVFLHEMTAEFGTTPEFSGKISKAIMESLQQ